MFIYNITPTASVATSASANTDVDHLRTLTVAGRAARIIGCYLIGKGAALTSLTGIVIKLKRFSTPSTVGSAITPAPRDIVAAPAADLTAFTGPTIGTTPTIQVAFGCGAAGPGGWVAPNEKAGIFLGAGGGANGNLDLISQTGGTTAMNFEYSTEHEEG